MTAMTRDFDRVPNDRSWPNATGTTHRIYGRYCTADINGRAAAVSSVANDPKRTLARTGDFLAEQSKSALCS